MAGFEEDLSVDIKHDFKQYDLAFFDGLLSERVTLEWSSRMTLCAGICYWKKTPSASKIREASKSPDGVEKLLEGYPRCIIRLSEPLLKFRSAKEVRETLAHEMIHAHCFIHSIEANRDGHGPEFQRIMRLINSYTGMNITVYHSFHDEVNHHRKFVWKCNGPCSKLPPYYGLVKRAKNWPPGPSSWWWDKHQATCGGKYELISAPPEQTERKKSKTRDDAAIKGTRTLESCFAKSLPSSTHTSPTPTVSAECRSDSEVQAMDSQIDAMSEAERLALIERDPSWAAVFQLCGRSGDEKLPSGISQQDQQIVEGVKPCLGQDTISSVEAPYSSVVQISDTEDEADSKAPICENKGSGSGGKCSAMSTFSAKGSARTSSVVRARFKASGSRRKGMSDILAGRSPPPNMSAPTIWASSDLLPLQCDVSTQLK